MAVTASSDDAADAARAAGLQYSRDDSPGITRRRAGRGWSYRDAQGAPLHDAAVLARMRALAIPPAWTEVWINPNPRGHLQATGRDARGRKQYRYHQRWRATRDETKFSHLVRFGEVLPRIRARVAADLALPGLPREKILATVVRLLDESLIRVGNVEYERDNRSFGLTTLHEDHVDIVGATLRFGFRGKSGKLHEIDVRDRRVARIVRRLQDLPGQHLFQYLDESETRQMIASDDVNAYLREIAGDDVTARDFRTWAGTVLAARCLRAAEAAESEAGRHANVVSAIDAVAARLGNTRAVCRAAYVHPAVIHGYESNRFCDVKGGHRSPAGLDGDERWLLAYLRSRAVEKRPKADSR